MHEMSLAEGVLQVIEDKSKIKGFSRVKTVWLEIGELAGVEVESMRFCFDAVMKGTLADGARLEIIAIKGQGQCLTCSKMVSIRLRYDPCPLCGSYLVEPTGGLEMKVKELEVD